MQGNNPLRPQILKWRKDPVLFVEEVLGVVPNPDQRSLLKAMPDNKFIAVKSAHGTGKTCCLAWIILWFLMCHSNSRVPITAPTASQLTQVLWPEIAKWLRGSKIEDVIEWSKSKVWIKGEEQTAFSIYRTSSKPEALQGFHEGNILFLLEEASGVEDPIWEPIEGALTTKNARAIAVGNPTRAEGNFYRAFTDQAAFWHNLTFNGEISEQVNPEYCVRMAKKYGKESDIYRIRVLGEFPSQVADAFIPLHLCERSLGHEVEDNQRPRMGVDVARFGDNYTVWLIRKGGRIVYMERVQTMDTMQIAGKTQILARENNVDPDKICIDSIGVGGGVVDRLHELNWDVKGVNVGMKPANEEDYYNLRSELWGIVKQELIDKKLNLTIENDREMTQDLCGELASPKYKLTSKGQYQLEGKEDMKKRGVMSPDIGDSLTLSYYRGIGEGNKIMSASPTLYPTNY